MAAVIARTRCGWIKSKECGELLYGRRFSIKLKRAVYGCYVTPVILYASEGRKRDENFMKDREENCESKVAQRQKMI